MKSYTFIFLSVMFLLYIFQVGIVVGRFGQEKKGTYNYADLFVGITMSVLFGTAIFIEFFQ